MKKLGIIVISVALDMVGMGMAEPGVRQINEVQETLGFNNSYRRRKFQCGE